MTTPWSSWITAKTGMSAPARDQLVQYQLQKLRETVEWAQRNSAAYRERLARVTPDLIRTPDDVSLLPFTTEEDLRQHPTGFLCVSQSEIDRVVTFTTSGSCGTAKRISFTAADQESTIDFFHHALSQFAGPSDRILITLPAERPGSAGHMLASAVERLGATPLEAPPVAADPAAALAALIRHRTTSVIGIPTHLLALARRSPAGLRLNSAAMCSDHVPDAIVRVLQQTWGCEVFQHYGSTEMGFGGGVDCHAHDGYHLREADLYIEIIDPASGTALAPGHTGEVVFTTLTRRGMPLIRYRTGDLSRIVPAPCACGSVLRRLERIRERRNSSISIGTGNQVTLAVLDEALFSLPGVLDFSAALEGKRLIVTVKRLFPRLTGVRAALRRLPAIARAERAGDLELEVRLGDATQSGQKRSISCAA